MHIQQPMLLQPDERSFLLLAVVAGTVFPSESVSLFLRPPHPVLMVAKKKKKKKKNVEGLFRGIHTCCGAFLEKRDPKIINYFSFKYILNISLTKRIFKLNKGVIGVQ